MAEKKDKRIIELPEIQTSNIYPDTYFGVDSTPTNENPGNIDQTSKIKYSTLLAQIKHDLTSTIDSEVSGEIDEFSKGLLDKMYPVGSIFITTDTRTPAEIFGGGAWVQIKDKFLLCSGDTYTAGAEGGAETVTLTGAQSGVNQHTHSFTQPTISSSGAATISGGSHTHAAPDIPGKGGRAMIGYNREELGGTVNCGEMRVKGDSTSKSVVPRISTTSSLANWAMFQRTAAETHSHSLGNHTHTATKGAVGAATATSFDATEPHNNMPPYLAVNVWRRVADSAPTPTTTPDPWDDIDENYQLVIYGDGETNGWNIPANAQAFINTVEVYDNNKQDVTSEYPKQVWVISQRVVMLNNPPLPDGYIAIISFII